MDSIQTITEDQIKTALLNSGYLLENRLITLISENDYYVFPNDVYKDKFTSKSREIDIYASSKRIVKGIDYSNDVRLVHINTSLIIECQNNTQPIVFLKKKQKNTFTCFDKYKYFLTKFNNDQVDSGIEFEYLESFIGKSNFHYNDKNLSTQYCSFSQKKTVNKNEWMASHPDGLYDTFTKLFHFTNDKLQSIADFRGKIQFGEFYYGILYPILVVQGALYDSEEKDGDITLTRLGHKLFEFNYFDDTSHTILIDVVTEDYFPTHLAQIKKEGTLFLKNFVRILEEQKNSR